MSGQEWGPEASRQLIDTCCVSGAAGPPAIPLGDPWDAGTPGRGVSVGLPDCHLGPKGRSLVPSTNTTEIMFQVAYPKPEVSW